MTSLLSNSVFGSAMTPTNTFFLGVVTVCSFITFIISANNAYKKNNNDKYGSNARNATTIFTLLSIFTLYMYLIYTISNNYDCGLKEIGSFNMFIVFVFIIFTISSIILIISIWSSDNSNENPLNKPLWLSSVILNSIQFFICFVSICAMIAISYYKYQATGPANLLLNGVNMASNLKI